MINFDPSSDATPRSLLSGMRHGDGNAWTRMVDRYSPLVYGMCRKAGVPPHDAADILQDTFRSVLQSFERFRHDRPGDGLRPWLRTIVANKIRDFFRREACRAAGPGGTTARQRLEAVPDPHGSSESLAENAPDFELHEALRQVKANFEPHVWQIFWMTAVEQRPDDEAATQFGMTANAVRQARFRVRQRLLKELGDGWAPKPPA
jgi:RNA polymerase sigma-70 factor (ECF subfamily)